MASPYDYSLDFTPIQLGLQALQQGNVRRQEQEREDARFKVLQQQQEREQAVFERDQQFREFTGSEGYSPEEAVKLYPEKLGDIQAHEQYRTTLREQGGQRKSQDFYNLIQDAKRTGDRSKVNEYLEQERGLIDTTGDPSLNVDAITQMDLDTLEDMALTTHRQAGGDVQRLTGTKKAQKTSTVDLGDRVAIIDAQGNTIRELTKGTGLHAQKPMSVHLQKRLSDASDLAISSQSSASEYEALASDFEKIQVGGGAIAQWGEAYKEQTGQQDAISNLKRRWNGIRASEVAKNLPPGAASDTDIALALSAFPSNKATGTQISSFLRGLSKIESRRAEFNNFKAEYISENRHERDLLKRWNERQRSEEAAQAQAELDRVPEGGGQAVETGELSQRKETGEYEISDEELFRIANLEQGTAQPQPRQPAAQPQPQPGQQRPPLTQQQKRDLLNQAYMQAYP